jgi:dihydroorotate dehydrogenase (NAD+) catalytic subunit
MLDLSVNIGNIQWKNPITTASGTFSPKESFELYDYSKLGAVTTKGISITPWRGNDTPRIAESSSGILNSVGLENPGVSAYLEKDIPFLNKSLKGSDCKIITNVAGHSEDEYMQAVEELNTCEYIHMLEINISCPNIAEGGMSFGTDGETAYKLTKSLKSITDKPLILKLTPNVTDICQIAEAVEHGGANAISLINTLHAMRIDINTGKPILSNIKGGLSGPAIKPVALKMVYDVSRSVNIPLIGMGGIATGNDAVEFIMAGASAVAVGTAALVEPDAPLRILRELEDFMNDNGYNTIDEIRNVMR